LFTIDNAYALPILHNVFTTYLNVLYTPYISKNFARDYLLINSVKHWPILVVCGVQRREETGRTGK